MRLFDRHMPHMPHMGPLFMTSDPACLPPGDAVDARQVKDAVLAYVFAR
jgi:hypothetical protein